MGELGPWLATVLLPESPQSIAMEAVSRTQRWVAIIGQDMLHFQVENELVRQIASWWDVGPGYPQSAVYGMKEK